ncbi:MAG: type IX secretion system membrane protein PorP/SprF [Flavobacteriales bacterium]
MESKTTVMFSKLGVFTLLMILSELFNPTQLSAQDPEFTQFYANPLYLNPAMAGTHRCPRFISNYRNQWPAISGTFVTYSASYDQHVDILSGGVGVLVTQDRAGEGTLNTLNASLLYSYHLPVTKSFSIKVGFQGTYHQKSVDWSKLTFGDMIDAKIGFSKPTQEIQPNTTVSMVDFSAGILGYSKTFFIGGAVHHILEPNEAFFAGNESPLPMKFTGHAGAVIPIGQQPKGRNKGMPQSSISPNVLFRMQKDFQQLNLGVYVTKGPIVGGIWYRNSDSFILLVGVQQGFFKFGYSYDVTVSKLSNATAGSHEISLALLFDCKPRTKKFRPLSCPSF